MVEKKTVMVGMSGGVDSSTVAAILHNQGYNVIGVTLQLYSSDEKNKNAKACCGSRDIFDAKTVCANLGIKHYVINYESTFKRDVIDDFVEGYRSGITPIPCIKCNQSVKFRDMLGVANDLGIEYIATGHYVKRVEVDGRVEMHKAFDKTKDQSYFLFATTKDQLARTLFPLGDFPKSKTREIAAELGIATAAKKESQDICFIPDGDYGKFLTKIDPSFEKTGDIVLEESGMVIGSHKGAVFYTVGQRRGIGVGGTTEPLYVSRIDVAQNIVYVANEADLYSSEFEITNMNFLKSGLEDLAEFKCNVIVRALKPEISATITRISTDRYKVVLDKPERAITAGQACVMYDGEVVLGGGFIG
jgi:tRNA-uridine 2-sulfurtransferase